eukprot:CCRYP_004734-RA/>CCRYP_004734-RA protein AED:0.31 eAED:0.33 QI:0/0/0.5/1/0/0/2/1631/76
MRNGLAVVYRDLLSPSRQAFTAAKFILASLILLLAARRNDDFRGFIICLLLRLSYAKQEYALDTSSWSISSNIDFS